MFPAKKHLGQALADLLAHHNERDFSERQRLTSELRKAQQGATETSSSTDLASQKKKELERQIEAQASQVRQMQEQVADLANLD